jgi:hypothetical protein
VFGKVMAPSRRDCPLCGSKTRYVQTLIGRMTGFSVRKCTKCRFVDPQRVKLYPDYGQNRGSE